MATLGFDPEQSEIGKNPLYPDPCVIFGWGHWSDADILRAFLINGEKVLLRIVEERAPQYQTLLSEEDSTTDALLGCILEGHAPLYARCNKEGIAFAQKELAEWVKPEDLAVWRNAIWEEIKRTQDPVVLMSVRRLLGLC
ncbi:MAG: hypothetical protein WC243_02955 [Patescibacteria group bacterium]|jgi:hypothetical protein